MDPFVIQGIAFVFFGFGAFWVRFGLGVIIGDLRDSRIPKGSPKN